jgi:hypothetical protein
MSKRRRKAQADYIDQVLNPLRGTFSQSLNDDEREYWLWYRYLLDVCISTRIRGWRGVPADVDLRWVETWLTMSPLLVLFSPSQVGAPIDPDTREATIEPLGYGVPYAMYQAASGLNQDIYNNPTHITATAPSSDLKHPPSVQLNRGEYAACWNNLSRWPDWNFLDIYARRLSGLKRTGDINALQMRNPDVYVVPESMQYELKQLVGQAASGQPVITALPELIQQMEVNQLKPDRTYLMPQVLADTFGILNEAYTYLGVSNVNVAKLAGVSASEVQANDEAVEARAFSYAYCRQQFCAQANAIFGLQMSYDAPTLAEVAERKEEANDDAD